MRRITLPLYAGGFLGPFGGAMLVALIPNVADGLDASIAQVAAAITAYMVPFALLQLVSGTVAERLGPRRVVRGGYVAFGLAALACALAPDIWLFLGARAAMGAANAFLSPILLAALSEVAAPDVLGRTVGTFAAAQTAGLMLAPILGGLLGEISWRLAFVLVAVVAAVLALPRQTLGAAERSALGRARLAPRAPEPLDRAAGDAGGARLPRLHGHRLRARPRRRRGVRARIGRARAAHRRLRRSAASCSGATRAPSSTAPGARPPRSPARSRAPPASSASSSRPSAWALGLVFFGIGCASTFVWAGLNTIAVESFPENRAGATSAYSAFKFAGVAIAPLIYVPLFDVDTRLPFVLAAIFSALLAVSILPWFRRYA